MNRDHLPPEIQHQQDLGWLSGVAMSMVGNILINLGAVSCSGKQSVPDLTCAVPAQLPLSNSVDQLKFINCSTARTARHFIDTHHLLETLAVLGSDIFCLLACRT